MANIQRYGNLLDEFFGDLNKGYWVRPFTMPGETELRMKVDVDETDKAYLVHAEIPGVKKDEIQIDINADQVLIRAEVKRETEKKEGEKVLHSERYYGMVSRSFTLPTDVDAEGAVANYKDGVLELKLPKKAGAQAKRLAVH